MKKLLLMVFVVGLASAGLIVAGDGEVEYKTFDGIIVKSSLIASKSIMVNENSEGARIMMNASGNSTSLLLNDKNGNKVVGLYMTYDPKDKSYSPVMSMKSGKNTMGFYFVGNDVYIVTNKKLINLNKLTGAGVTNR